MKFSKLSEEEENWFLSTEFAARQLSQAPGVKRQIRGF